MSWSTTVGTILVMTVVSGAGAPIAAQNAAEGLAGFGRLVTGEWVANDSRHRFEWGVGGQVIHSKSYFPGDDGWVLVSEGMWYWDPAARAIRGVVVAIDMPVTLFEYRTRVEGETVVHDLVSHGEMGGRYEERWAFDASGYRWTLRSSPGDERIMGGRYERAAPR